MAKLSLSAIGRVEADEELTFDYVDRDEEKRESGRCCVLTPCGSNGDLLLPLPFQRALMVLLLPIAIVGGVVIGVGLDVGRRSDSN